MLEITEKNGKRRWSSEDVQGMKMKVENCEIERRGRRKITKKDLKKIQR